MARGSDPRVSSSNRSDALVGAIRLCPSDPLPYHALAALLIAQQQFQTALGWLRRGLKASPNNPRLKTDLSIAWLEVGRPEQALSVLQRLPESAIHDFYLGMAYRALNEHRLAQQALLHSFKMGNRDPYVLYALIEQDRALHDTQAGLRDFKTLDQTLPHSAWLHLVLGDAYRAHHDLGNATKEYQFAASLNAALPVVHYRLGRIAFDLGNYAQAISDFQQEIALDPSFGPAWLYLGTSLRRAGENKRALPCLQEAVARDPGEPLGYVELATALIQAGKPHEALRTLTEGERRFPRDASFPAQLSHLMRTLGDLSGANKQAAIAESLSRENNPELSGALKPGHSPQAARSPAEMETLRRCIQRADATCASAVLRRLPESGALESADDLNLEAQALNLVHRRKEALAAVDKAIRIDPNQPSYLITQGHIEQRLGDQVAAIQSFLRAEKLKPGAEVPIYDVGMSFFLIGWYNNQDAYYQRAGEHFKAALQLDPRDDKAEFMLGVTEVMKFKLNNAKRHFERAIQLKPSNPDYHLYYGILLNRLGDQAGAFRELKVAEKLSPFYARPYFSMGDLLAQTGQLEQAKKQLEEGVRLAPSFAAAYFTLGHVYYRLGLRTQADAALRRFEQLKALAHQPDKDPVDQAMTSAESNPSPTKP